MAATPPALVVRPRFPRPDPALVARLAQSSTGWIVDANGRRGALDWRIRPLTRATRFGGVALTVRNRPRDNLAAYAALKYVRPGDVLVIATEAYEEASVAGDVLVSMARNAGVVAIVTDGMVRDIEGIDAVGIPVYARGLTPNSPHKDGPGEIGTAVTIGGVAVASGDVVVGGVDGVVVVARERAADVAAGLDEVAAKEAKMDGWVRDGAKAPPWLDETLAKLGVREVD